MIKNLLILIVSISSLLIIPFMFFNKDKLEILVTSIIPTPTIKIVFDENKLWYLLNDWEKRQGYQEYMKDENLCIVSNLMLDNNTLIKENWNSWFQKTTLSSTYSDAASLSMANAYSEEDILYRWISDIRFEKIIRDDYYKYSCIKCKGKHCVGVFANR